jgi:hypothetical protein
MELSIASAFTLGGLVGNASYVLLIASMAMRDIFWLRLLALGSGVTGIAYDAIWLLNPVGIFWESCFTLVNLTQWIALSIERRRATLTPYQVALRDSVFPTLSNVDVLKLLALAQKRTPEHLPSLIEKGSEVTHLYLVEHGQATVVLDEVEVSRCQPGDFIGEIGFLNRVPACATVSAGPELECLVFDCDELRRTMSSNPEFERGITFALNANLASKLIRNNETYVSV